MTRHLTRALAIVGLLGIAAGGVIAAEKAEKKGERRAERQGRAASRPAFVDPEHAPRGKGWIPLFNGKDLEGWKSFPANKPNTWKAEKRELVSTFPEGEHGTNIYTDRKFQDFEIYYEYLVPKDGNSGVFLRGQYEIQIKQDYGRPADKPDDWGNGGIYGQKAPSKNASKPLGEWQAVYATMIGKEITVYLNGEKIIDKWVPPRPTHLYGELGVKAGDPSGPIVLQGDHKPIRFRRIFIKPLKE